MDGLRPWVSDGTRTRDILDHNQVLYQLSYTHHAPTWASGADHGSGSSIGYRSGIGALTDRAAACASSELGPGAGTNTVRR
jgi:hypothetical protein